MIPLMSKSYREAKLIDRSILIVTKLDAYTGFYIDLINIRDDKKWYHVTTYLHFLIRMEKLLSGIMLVGYNSIGNYENDPFSSCKILYINQDSLTPYKTSIRNFTEFYKPKENVIVFGIFKTTLILLDQRDSNFYFLSYNKKLQLEFCKRLEPSIYIDEFII